MTWLEKIKDYYTTDRWTAQQVRNVVASGVITSEQAEEIIASKNASTTH